MTPLNVAMIQQLASAPQRPAVPGLNQKLLLEHMKQFYNNPRLNPPVDPNHYNPVQPGYNPQDLFNNYIS